MIVCYLVGLFLEVKDEPIQAAGIYHLMKYLSTSFTDTTQDPQKGLSLWRFFRTFIVSFLLTFSVLLSLNMVPQGVYELPHRVYVWTMTLFSFDEAALVAVLPPPSTTVDDGVFRASVSATSSVSVRPGVVIADRGIDWLPVPIQNNPSLPIRVSIPIANIEVPIVSPASTDVDTLDEALTKGVVLYPNSGVLGARNNMLFFGHSSHLPVVNNPAYKAFNNLEYVRLGDDIYLDSTDTRFRYRVSSVRLTTADEELISFNTSRRMITLSTCNTFGKKAERFVVEAIFVGATSLKVVATN